MDDTQLYVPFTKDIEVETLQRLEQCLIEVRQWMAINFLKRNYSKTEYILFGTEMNKTYLMTEKVTVGDAAIPTSNTV